MMMRDAFQRLEAHPITSFVNLNYSSERLTLSLAFAVALGLLLPLTFLPHFSQFSHLLLLLYFLLL